MADKYVAWLFEFPQPPSAVKYTWARLYDYPASDSVNDMFGWLGVYNAATTIARYELGDLIGFKDIIYVCIRPYNHSAVITPEDAAHWAPLQDPVIVNEDPPYGLTWQGVWKQLRTYTGSNTLNAAGYPADPRDVVKYDDEFYVALRTHVAVQAPFSSVAPAGGTVPSAPLPIRHFWSGGYTLDFMGEQWSSAASIIDVSDVNDTIGAPQSRFTLSMDATDPTIRSLLLTDFGPLEVVIRWIWSADGSTWQALPRTFRGRLSSPVLDAARYTVELETANGDIPIAERRMWSDEDQRQRYPADRGFEFARQISEGIDIVWPP